MVNKLCQIVILSGETAYVLIYSIACALSWFALCISARIRTSAADSTDKFEHSDSSHITFNRSRSY